jgi:hypothetical protein
MAKLVLMSVIFFPMILAIRASASPNPRTGLRRAVVGTLVFTILWALLAPWLVGALGS